jgi:hypothetical protein
LLLILGKIEQFYRPEAPSVLPVVVNSHQAFNYESVWRGCLVRETLFLRFPVYDDKLLVLNVLERL